MPSKYWIKLYIEILDDLKMGMMSDTMWRRTIELFLVAGEYAEEGKLPPLKELSWRIRIPEDELTEILKILEELKIIAFDGKNWYVLNFIKRQTSESLERVRRFREREKEKNNERYSNVTVTKEGNGYNGVNVLSSSISDSLISNNDSLINIFKEYEHNIGLITPAISEAIIESIDEYGDGWCIEAIKKAAKMEKRSWAYCEGILRGWKRDGFNAARAPAAESQEAMFERLAREED